MLTLISPAKKLLTPSKPYLAKTSEPIFHKKTLELMAVLKDLSVSKIANLMHLSKDLAELNYQRYQSFHREGSHCYPAVFLFRGDVYKSLNADLWDTETIEFAQSHLMILSGLYGLLRPLDLIQAYRLEMGTQLANSCGKNLYNFWQQTITHELNNYLSLQKNPLLINLASTEYFTAVDVSMLQAPVLTIHFKEQIGNELKVIGIHAKKARGAMANYICKNQIEDIEQLKQFTALNYRFCETSSDEKNFNFFRA